MAAADKPKIQTGSAGQQKDAPDRSAALVETPATCTLTINKQRITTDISHVQLEQFVDKHHVLTVRIRELGKVSAQADFGDPKTYTALLGKSLSLNIKPEGGQVDAAKELAFIGVVTQITVQNSIDGINTVTIVGQSPTISLDGHRHNVFYRDQSASDIIGAILRRYPISLGTVESSQGTLKFSVQHRETDYEYIMRLAGEYGLFACYDGQEFRVTKANSSKVEELIWRESLGLFSLGLGTAAYEFGTQVYNYEQKKTYSQDSTSLSQQAALSDVSRISPDASKDVFPKSGYAASPQVVGDAQSLDQILQRERSRALGRMIVCRGQSLIPKVAVGQCVRVKGMDRLDATYWVLSARHIFDESGKYHNTFECTPLDMAFPQSASTRPPITHLQMAVVLDNNDPDKLGRIKVKFPWNDTDETPWIRVMSPHAGADRGWYCLPEIGDEVLVGYEQGSADLPVVLGSLYNKDDKPPGKAIDAKNSVKMFMTRCGNQIVLDDTDGDEKVLIITKDGKNKITMKTGGPTEVESEGAINITGKKDITIKGANITLDSQGDVKIKAAGNASMEATANLTAKGSAQVEIQGTTVTVKGNPIQLN